MRISLWQQFSSNHSAFYSITGTFKTIEEAQKAYLEIREILQEIDRWHRENPEGFMSQWSYGVPFPPEQTIADRYGIEWTEPIDWTGWADYRLIGHPMYKGIDPSENAMRLIDKALSIVANIVNADSPNQTYMTGLPFKNLFEHFGADVSGVGVDPGGEIVFEKGGYRMPQLHFEAPNEDIANQIEAAIKNYLRFDLVSESNLPPWYDDKTNFEKIAATSKVLDSKQITILQRDWQEDYDSLMRVAGHVLSNQRRPQERLALYINTAELIRDGLKFIFEGYVFHNSELGLAALIAYLEVNGCTNIFISHRDMPHEPDENTLEEPEDY